MWTRAAAPLRVSWHRAYSLCLTQGYNMRGRMSLVQLMVAVDEMSNARPNSISWQAGHRR